MWNCRRKFLATVATGRDPNNNNTVRQCHKCLHIIFFLWGNHENEASLGVLLRPCKQRNCMTKQSSIQVLGFMLVLVIFGLWLLHGTESAPLIHDSNSIQLSNCLGACVSLTPRYLNRYYFYADWLIVSNIITASRVSPTCLRVFAKSLRVSAGKCSLRIECTVSWKSAFICDNIFCLKWRLHQSPRKYSSCGKHYLHLVVMPDSQALRYSI